MATFKTTKKEEQDVSNPPFLPIHLSASQPAPVICLTISLITTDSISIISANYPLPRPIQKSPDTDDR